MVPFIQDLFDFHKVPLFPGVIAPGTQSAAIDIHYSLFGTLHWYKHNDSKKKNRQITCSRCNERILQERSQFGDMLGCWATWHGIFGPAAGMHRLLLSFAGTPPHSASRAPPLTPSHQ